MELAGRTALVTGGSSDIGAAIAWGLARRGADVAIHYHHNGERAEALVTEVLALGRRCAAVGGDLTSSDDVKRVAAEASALGPIDILVNNAGAPLRRVHWTALDGPFLDAVFGLNYRAPLYSASSSRRAWWSAGGAW